MTEYNLGVQKWIIHFILSLSVQFKTADAIHTFFWRTERRFDPTDPENEASASAVNVDH